MCFDRDRAQTDAQVNAWMRAWHGNRKNPRQEYESWLNDDKSEETQRAKGRSNSAPPGHLVLPKAIGKSRERLCVDANKELRRDQAWLDALPDQATRWVGNNGACGAR